MAYGCLRCRVTWEGQRQCWSCGDTSTYIVGAGVVWNDVLVSAALERATEAAR